jgi:hypothetical protein
MDSIDLSFYRNKGQVDFSKPTPLYRKGDHAVYWLGLSDDEPSPYNAYLLMDKNEVLLIDPGSRSQFEKVKHRVEQIVEPERITGLILCHHAANVSASMIDWLDFKRNIMVYATFRTHTMLSGYGTDYFFVDVSLNDRLKLPCGTEICFIEAPFLHSTGAMATYDRSSGFLFSGDIWAASGSDWNLVVDDFQQYSIKMDRTHLSDMPSNIATRGFLRRLQPYGIAAILPRQGSIIGRNFIGAALDYLRKLECGTDILYPDLAGGVELSSSKPSLALTEATNDCEDSSALDVPLFFGRFLVTTGLLDEKDLETALIAQRDLSDCFLCSALEIGLITVQDFAKCRTYQREKFGTAEEALRHIANLTDTDMTHLKAFMADMHVPVGEMLTKRGLLTPEKLEQALQDYERSSRMV